MLAPSEIGLLSLLVAFAALVVALVTLGMGSFFQAQKRQKSPFAGSADTFVWAGHAAVVLAFACLTLACGVLVWCFFQGDYSILYVLENHSSTNGRAAWLYKLSGLWAGREGSLLFWAWLIALFAAVMALRNQKAPRRLDSVALAIITVVLAAFVAVLLFSEDNMPFTITPTTYYDDDGTLATVSTLYGMNVLLEHWAMAIHPPTLFVGYSGLTVPFAYAVAALIVNDPSDAWVRASQRYALVAWLFLGIGIGLGAIWAYVVLGWGGYWGWDPVENASLLSWLVGVALIHSFTVYRQRGAFKRWSVLCACLTFAFVIVGTFISRSGIVESVHAFEGDPVSLALFGALIACSILVGIVGVIWRRRSFGPGVDENGEEIEEIESMASKQAAYYFNNVIMVVFATLLAYLTVASALPEWLPFGGTSVSTGTYNAIARPLGIFYLFILAFCPLLSWGRTNGRRFWRQVKVPGVLASLAFALLLIFYISYLKPAYDAIIAEGGTAAEELLEQGPSLYYNGLALVGLLVACILFFNALFMLMRMLRAGATSASTIGGAIAHLSMAVILVGLIGSSMYVTEVTGYAAYDEDTDTAEAFVVEEYTLEYTGNSITAVNSDTAYNYTVEFDVYKNGEYVGHVSPTVQLVVRTQQQKLVASVISFAEEDLFVVYRGVSSDGDFSLDIRINPLISWVWIGFGLMMVGVLVAACGRRGPRKKRAIEGFVAPEKLD